ncbi:Eco57I restriction-modification methylase domain-containing protein [Glutamicibacter protophormiae]|uniref:Eco57I restriction-modification methylase domain-containing protein n=1 Tax=Glutamicibacter protophormiae TaxID=37930 RepID=UPI0033256AB0
MDKKFDVVIGNPPYQGETVGDSTSAPPIYPQFMDAAHEIGSKSVLITPARFLFNAGYTSRLWNEKMLADEHLSAPIYVPNSNTLFPGTDIKGGVAVTYRDSDRKLGPITVFAKYAEISSIMDKVDASGANSFADLITKRDAFKYTQKMHNDHPSAEALMSNSAKYIIVANAFDKVSFLFTQNKPDSSDEYVQIVGLSEAKRVSRWVRREYISGPSNFNRYRVMIAAANGSGQLGESLSTPTVLDPDVAVTATFLTIGAFKEKRDAEACLKYVKTKFARTMLGVLKVTQHNPAKVWKFVPAQDFSSTSNINWSQSVAEIDRQLYKEYKLSDTEINFLESNVKAME